MQSLPSTPSLPLWRYALVDGVELTHFCHELDNVVSRSGGEMLHRDSGEKDIVHEKCSSSSSSSSSSKSSGITTPTLGEPELPNCFIICFPGSGGFGLDFAPDRLYSSLARDMPSPTFLRAHVVRIDFDGHCLCELNKPFLLDCGYHGIVTKMSKYLQLLPADVPIILIGWSYGGAVALELAAEINNGAHPSSISGVITVASQCIGTSDVHGYKCPHVERIEELSIPLFFIAGAEDLSFGEENSAVAIAKGFESRAIKSRDRSLLELKSGGHDCQLSRGAIYEWLLTRFKT